MNQHIEDLINEAGIAIWEDEWSGETVYGGNNVKQLERLVQLIVDKCAGIAEQQSPDRTYLAQAIKEHFR